MPENQNIQEKKRVLVRVLKRVWNHSLEISSFAYLVCGNGMHRDRPECDQIPI